MKYFYSKTTADMLDKNPEFIVRLMSLDSGSLGAYTPEEAFTHFIEGRKDPVELTEMILRPATNAHFLDVNLLLKNAISLYQEHSSHYDLGGDYLKEIPEDVLDGCSVDVVLHDDPRTVGLGEWNGESELMMAFGKALDEAGIKPPETFVSHCFGDTLFFLDRDGVGVQLIDEELKNLMRINDLRGNLEKKKKLAYDRSQLIESKIKDIPIDAESALVERYIAAISDESLSVVEVSDFKVFGDYCNE